MSGLVAVGFLVYYHYVCMCSTADVGGSVLEEWLGNSSL